MCSIRIHFNSHNNPWVTADNAEVGWLSGELIWRWSGNRVPGSGSFQSEPKLSAAASHRSLNSPVSFFKKWGFPCDQVTRLTIMSWFKVFLYSSSKPLLLVAPLTTIETLGALISEGFFFLSARCSDPPTTKAGFCKHDPLHSKLFSHWVFFLFLGRERVDEITELLEHASRAVSPSLH